MRRIVTLGMTAAIVILVIGVVIAGNSDENRPIVAQQATDTPTPYTTATIPPTATSGQPFAATPTPPTPPAFNRPTHPAGYYNSTSTPPSVPETVVPFTPVP